MFNPAVIVKDDTFYLFERACSSLAPLKCQVGLLKGQDGFHFELASGKPVLTPEDFGTPEGTVEDPRVVEIDGRFYMTFVHRNFAATCQPNGTGIPKYINAEPPAGDPNMYRSGIAVSDNMTDWEILGLITPPDVHDRDNVLFPEKISGKYVMLRRPEGYVGPKYGCEKMSIWMSFSENLTEWTDPVLIAQPEQPWEEKKIGAATPPLRTDAGWLALYHGVTYDAVYRVGAMLLDLDDPTKVLARTRDFFMEPREYYEMVGLIIPNVVFPSGNVIKDDTLYLYYGCCDTCISVATAPVQDVLDALHG